MNKFMNDHRSSQMYSKAMAHSDLFQSLFPERDVAEPCLTKPSSSFCLNTFHGTGHTAHLGWAG